MAAIPEYFDRVVPEVNYPLLRSKRVVIVGVGQVGSKIAAELANATIGALRFIDHDVLEEHNLYRHVLPREYLGKNKADALTVHLTRQVPTLNAEGIPRRVDPRVSPQLLDSWLRDADLIVGATDNPRAQLQIAARALGLQITAIFPALYPQQNGGEIIIQFDRRMPCFCCATEFRASVPQLEGVTGLGFYGLPVIERAVELSLALLEPRSRYAQLITPRRDEPPHQVFRLNNARALVSRPLEWLESCPTCGGVPLRSGVPEPPVSPASPIDTSVTRPLPKWPAPPPSPFPGARYRSPPVARTPTADQSASRNLKIGLSLLAALLLFVLIVGESGGSHVSPAEERQEKADTLVLERTAANARIAHLTFRCIEQPACSTDFVGNPLPLFIDGLDVQLASYLEHNGYQQQWSDNDDTLHAEGWDAGESSYVAVGTGGVGSNGKAAVQAGTGYILTSPAASTEKPGPTPSDLPTAGRWVITWQLRGPKGRPLRTLHYSVRIRAACGISADSYCERVSRKQMVGVERGTAAGAQGGYSTAVYQPPPLFPYSE